MGLITLTQAAASLGLVARGLRIQAEKGRLRAHKLGRDWVVESAEVERYRREVMGTHPGRQPGRGGEGQRRTGRTRMEPARKERPISDSLAGKSDGIAKVPRPKSDRTPKVPAGSHWIDPDGHGVYVSATDEPPDSDSRLSAMSDRFGIPRPAPKPRKKR